MSSTFSVAPLARHRDLVPLVAKSFVSEWPAWYGVGGEGNVAEDLEHFAESETTLPIGFIVFSNETPVGAAALKIESIPSHNHLSPWAAAGFVVPELRGKGIGAIMLKAMVVHARRLGHPHVYCGTSTSESLLQRSGWSAIEAIQHAGKAMTIFRSAA